MFRLLLLLNQLMLFDIFDIDKWVNLSADGAFPVQFYPLKDTTIVKLVIAVKFEVFVKSASFI